MNTIDDFIAMLQDQIGLVVSGDAISGHFDEVPGWDSVHLLNLVAAMETRTGRSVPLPDLLEAESLQQIYSLYTS